MPLTVCVQGLWHLGSVTAACLASVGHHVIGLDRAPTTISGLAGGNAPLYEPGLDALVQAGLAGGNLRFTTNPREALAEADVLWVALDTPVDDEDQADVDFVVGEVCSVLPELAQGTLVLVSSQLPVGSVRKLEQFAASTLPDRQLRFACAPENLRLGKAIEVFLKPDRMVVGVRTAPDQQQLERLLTPVTDRIEWMSVESAEMTKHAINAFLATSITFANEIAALCELAGADAKEVERGLKSEQRIGPKAYLAPGGPFAGGTLARDIQYLTQIGQAQQLATPLLAAVTPSNNEHKNWSKRRLLARFPNLAGKTVAVWGLTYKPGTNTLRRSLAVELCNWLHAQGAHLRVHDPVVTDCPPGWGNQAIMVDRPLDALAKADALVIATEWPLYKDVDFSGITARTPKLLVLDANRFLPQLASLPGIEYAAVGSAPPTVG